MSCVTSTFLLFISGLHSSGLQSILSVIVSPLFSLFSTPKPIFIGEGRTGPTPRLQHSSQKIRPRHTRQPSSSSHSSNTLSSNDTTRSTYSNRRRTPSPSGPRFRNDTHNTSESPIPSRPSTPQLMSIPPSTSQPRSPKNDLRTYLGMRKRSTLLAEPTPEEPSPTASNDEFDLDEGSHGQYSDRAKIIVSPPTPSSSVFLHSAPGPSEVHFTPGKPAARFVKSHSKRHSLTAGCPRKSSLDGHPITSMGNADECAWQANGGSANGRQTHPPQNPHHPQRRPWPSRNGTSPLTNHNGKSENRYESHLPAGAPRQQCLLRTEMMWVVEQYTRSPLASFGLRYPGYHLPLLVRVQLGRAHTKRLISSLPQAVRRRSATRKGFLRNEDQCSSTLTPHP